MKIDFYTPVKIISGKNALIENAGELKNLGKRCLIVTGGSSAQKSGALADVETALKNNDIEYKIFDEIEQNPFTKTCMRAGTAAREFNADFILGIGGGSPLDAAKAAAIYAANASFEHSDIYKREENCPRLPVALIGTTAGTGSEVTAVSVLTNSDSGIKKSINGSDCFAEIAFCDAKYTNSLPYDISVSTALDAFAHAVESFLAENSNEMSELFAEKAISEIWPALMYFYNTKKLPRDKMREELYYASIFAGLAIAVTGTLFPHTLGYVLSEDYGVPHGKACTAFMKTLINMSMNHAFAKTNRLFSLCNADYNEFLKVISTLTDVNIKLSDSDIENYCTRWDDSIKNFIRTPGGFTIEGAREALTSL